MNKYAVQIYFRYIFVKNSKRKYVQRIKSSKKDNLTTFFCKVIALTNYFILNFQILNFKDIDTLDKTDQTRNVFKSMCVVKEILYFLRSESHHDFFLSFFLLKSCRFCTQVKKVLFLR